MATEVKAEAKPQEAKAETKTEGKAEVKEEAEEEAAEPPLKYKTWVLKVSVHCEACKRKVKKILTNIEGVYTTDIDLRQQKVTVVGNVEAETLIKRLIKKTGKHAELWPEKADQKEKKKGKAKNKEKEKEKQQSDQENNNSEEDNNNGGENEKETVVKAEVVKIQDPTPPTKATAENVHVNNIISHKPPSEAGGGGGAKTGTVQVKEVKIDVKPTTVTLPAGNQSPVAEKKVGGESEGGADKNGGGGGGGGKKKKKKGHKGNSTNSNNNNNNHGEEGEHSSSHAPAGSGSPTHHTIGHQVPMVHPANQSPPRHHHGYHDYPVQHYYAPPVYAVSSNVAYPSTSYGGSYYAPSYSYAYMHPGNASVEPPPPDLESYSSQPSDSFEIFSDENPNACSVM